MAFVLKDRVKETTSTTGTGSVTLLGAPQGFQSFSEIGNGNTTYYTIAGVAEWEVGIGTYSAGVLTRDTVLASSNGGQKVLLSNGIKDVFCTYAATKAISADTIQLTFGANEAVPNATVKVASITSNVSATNGDLALVPKGSGALIAQVPDNTVTGGNKRGTYAVDFSRERLLADFVASGNYSVVGGGYSLKSSGDYSVCAGGYAAAATGTYSVCAGGALNEASGAYSYVVGSSNVASGDWSAVVNGSSNVSSGTHSFTSGSVNVASGAYSAVLGGIRGTTRGISGFIVSSACSTPISTTKVGVNQTGVLIVAAQTTNATPRVLSSDSNAAGAANQLIILNNSAAYIRGTVIANVTGGGNTKSWTFDAQIKRGANAAATTLTGSTVTSPYGDAGASAWTVALSADTTNGGLAVTVTGQASTTIRWVCRLESTEVAF